MSLAESRPRLSVGPGDVLVGRYELVSEVGAGGFGTVFRARHCHTGNDVALKLLHARYAIDDAVRERFRRETRAPAEIGHPGIVRIFDADVTEDGTPFIAMEWLAGKTMRDRYREEMPQLGRVLEIFDELLDALAAAHELGYVHRDLKPDNTFITLRPDGSERVKLLDFGLARQTGSQSVTKTGTSLGTPRYMSPEQFMDSKQVRATTDVWAVGVMLYEMIAGAPPFAADGQNALMLQILTKAHRPLASAAPHAPAPLVELVERCLVKEPKQRIADADVLLAELRKVRPLLTSEAASTVVEMPRFEITAAAPEPPAESSGERSDDGVNVTKPSGPNALRGHLAAARDLASPTKPQRVSSPLSRARTTPFSDRRPSPAPQPVRATPAPKRRPLLLLFGVLGVVGAVALVIAGVALYALWPRSTQPVRVVEPAEPSEPRALPEFPSLPPMQPATGPVAEVPAADEVLAADEVHAPTPPNRPPSQRPAPQTAEPAAESESETPAETEEETDAPPPPPPPEGEGESSPWPFDPRHIPGFGSGAD